MKGFLLALVVIAGVALLAGLGTELVQGRSAPNSWIGPDHRDHTGSGDPAFDPLRPIRTDGVAGALPPELDGGRVRYTRPYYVPPAGAAVAVAGKAARTGQDGRSP